MSEARFKEKGADSFYGSYLYERIVPQDHFLVKLKELVPWHKFTKKLLRYYRGEGQVGQRPYDPAVILKILLLSYLYNISERQVELFVNDSLSAKHFLGLAVDEAAPDHTTLTVFKNRLLERSGQRAYEMLLGDILRIARAKGIKLGSLQVLDSVHTVADVNTDKDERKRDTQPPRDGDARWGVKHSRKVKDEAGVEHRQTEYFYGYKQHVSLNAETGLITNVHHTPGNAYDGHELPRLIKKDLRKRVPVTVVAADRGYDDGENHEFLRGQGIASAIRLNGYRIKKKNPNKEGWLRLVESHAYREGGKQRYKVEQKFGEMKTRHGFRRCRYLGLARYAVQGYLTAMVVNLKRVVKLLAGVGFSSGPVFATAGLR